MVGLAGFSNIVELWFSKCYSTSRCNSCRNFVDIIYNYSEGPIKRLAKSSLQEVNLEMNEGTLNMGIHYDYKSTRGDKAMKKEAKRKARIEAKKSKAFSQQLSRVRGKINA